MTDATFIPPRRGRARLRLRIEREDDQDDPGHRTSWVVRARRLFVVWVEIGHVNANGAAEALSVAAARWPNERHLRVSVDPRR